MVHVPTLIARKRDGDELSNAEIRELIRRFVADDVPDYQMSAFAMAVYFRGMSPGETAALTEAIIDSGDRFRHRVPHPPVVDKHSTGGVGDKVSLVLGPLLAASGCWVPMVVGRGLGITGGTLDKLESIPGLRTTPSPEEVELQLERLGIVMMGQTDRFCPADKRLYALRDVTGTVPSIPLIAASIMAKKLAESLDRLVLDVKFGTGAFMRSRKQAEELANAMIGVGREMGVEVHALLHPMSEPTGRAIGNALEVAEAYQCLCGGGPEDLRKVVLDLAVMVAGTSRELLERHLDDGDALRVFERMVEAQGADPSDLSRITEIHHAPLIRDVPAPATGVVRRVDAGLLGQAAVQLGAGRAKVSDAVDFSVGFDQLVKCGDPIHHGQPVCRIHARCAVDFEMAEALVEKAIAVED